MLAGLPAICLNDNTKLVNFRINIEFDENIIIYLQLSKNLQFIKFEFNFYVSLFEHSYTKNKIKFVIIF